MSKFKKIIWFLKVISLMLVMCFTRLMQVPRADKNWFHGAALPRDSGRRNQSSHYSADAVVLKINVNYVTIAIIHFCQ